MTGDQELLVQSRVSIITPAQTAHKKIIAQPKRNYVLLVCM